MKKIHFIVALLATLLAPNFLFAQATIATTKAATTANVNDQKTGTKPTKGIETVSFNVSGNCGMCKRRIEEACVLPGVKAATWNAETQLLSVKFDNARTDLVKIKTRIAKAGHDVEGMASDEKAYKKLPACCQYREGKCTTH